MRVGIVSVQIPFISGGAELLAQGLREALIERGCHAEIITIPFLTQPVNTLLDNIKIARLLDLSLITGDNIDKVITLKFPAYYCYHPNKTLWLLHQHRAAYDFYNTEYTDIPSTWQGKKAVNKIKKLDKQLIPEHKNIFTISQNIANKLSTCSNIHANDVIYPPPLNDKHFKSDKFENFILYPSRFTSLKRQELIVAAMQWVTNDIKLVLIGDHDTPYGVTIKRMIEEFDLTQRVILKNLVSEEEKISLYANCLAVYNGVYDEDYGYVTIEAFLSGKPVIIHPDAGGPLEFVVNEQNGFVVEATPIAIADAINKLSNKKLSQMYGENGKESLKAKNVSWDFAIEKLLS